MSAFSSIAGIAGLFGGGSGGNSGVGNPFGGNGITNTADNHSTNINGIGGNGALTDFAQLLNISRGSPFNGGNTGEFGVPDSSYTAYHQVDTSFLGQNKNYLIFGAIALVAILIIGRH